MEAEQYEFLPFESLFYFEFYSDGPKGKIKKMVRFKLINIGGIDYYNLSFGDWDEDKKRIDDLVVTNNNDTEKILTTVAAAVIIFIKRFPDYSVYAKGSTAARTRFYRIVITTNWEIIDPILEVYGLINNKWEPFKKNVNYEAFFVKRK